MRYRNKKTGDTYSGDYFDHLVERFGLERLELEEINDSSTETPTENEDTPTEEDNMGKQDKPLSEWTLDEAQQYCIDFRERLEVRACEDADGCVLREKGICKAAKTWPHLWDLSRLTEPEIAIMRAVGAKWVSRDKGFDDVYLWSDKPKVSKDYEEYYIPSNPGDCISSTQARLFPSVKSGDCIELEDEK